MHIIKIVAPCCDNPDNFFSAHETMDSDVAAEVTAIMSAVKSDGIYFVYVDGVKYSTDSIDVLADVVDVLAEKLGVSVDLGQATKKGSGG